jgi:hypothetical protein
LIIFVPWRGDLHGGDQFSKCRLGGFVPVEQSGSCRAFDHSARSEAFIPSDRLECIEHRVRGRWIEHACSFIGNLAERWNRRAGRGNPRRQGFDQRQAESFKEARGEKSAGAVEERIEIAPGNPSGEVDIFGKAKGAHAVLQRSGGEPFETGDDQPVFRAAWNR